METLTLAVPDMISFDDTHGTMTEVNRLTLFFINIINNIKICLIYFWTVAKLN